MMQAWQRGGMQGAPPHCDETPLDKVLRRFHLIFPEIDLKSDSANFAVSCHRGGNSYGVDALSDGERQVLAMLMDLTCCAPPDALFLIDEPELNLHPLLACRLWDVIETELPQAIFVYATHCISFAMRANVETQILLRPLGQPAQLLPDISDLDPQQAQEFLGAIPAIAIARNVVAVEGNRDSFDAVFYQWLLGDEYKVVPLGACESVCGAARGAGLWNKITLGVRIAGVVDRDYRTDAELDKLRNDGLVVLDFHEAESYLCEPALLYALSQNLGIKPGLLQAELEKNLFEFAGKHASETAFERTKRAFNYRFQLSSGKIDWGANPDRLTIEGWLATMAQSEVSKLGAMSAGTLIKLFGSEKERIEKLIATRDATELLRIVPGKEMLAEMIRLVGLRSPADCINSVSANMKPDDHPHLSGLKQQLLTAFGK